MAEGYFDRHVLFHTHIAKSAGTSIRNALTDILGADAVMDRNRAVDPDTAVAVLSPQRRGTLKLLSGHFWYGTQERHFDRRPVYLAAVRDPIERFVSLFHFVLASDVHPLHREFAPRGPDGSALWFFLEKPRFANEMSYSFGVPQGTSPIDWVEKRYAIIAPTARVDSLVAQLYAIFAPEREPRVWRANRAPLSGFAVSAEVAAECRAAAARDMLLCRQIDERYDDWLNDLGRRLHIGE